MSAEMLIGFDPLSVDIDAGGGGALPVSDAKGHLVIIQEAEIKANAAPGSGEHLVLTLMINDGPFAGQVGSFRLNLFHATSAQAVDIAKRDLSKICHVVGHMTALAQPLVADLYNKPFRVVVSLQKGDEAAQKGWTEVKQILDINGAKPGQAAAVAPVAAAPAPVMAPAPVPVAAPAMAPAFAPVPVAAVAPVPTPVAVAVAPMPVAAVAAVPVAAVAPAMPVAAMPAITPGVAVPVPAPAVNQQIGQAIAAQAPGVDPAAKPAWATPPTA